MKWKKSDFKILLWPLGVIAAAALLYFLTPRLIELLGLLTGLLLPFIIGYVLAKAINPLADLLQRKFKFPRGVTVILVVLAVLGLVVGLVYWGASSLSGQVKALFVDNPDFKAYFMAQYSEAISKISVLYRSLPESVQDALSGAVSGTGSATGLVMDYAARFVKAMPNAFVAIIVAILSLYFMVSDSTSVTQIINRLFKIQTTKSALV